MVAQNDHHAALHNLLLANPFGQQLSSRSPFHREGVALPIATVRAAELAFKLRQALATSAWRDSFGRSPLLGSTGRQKLVKIGARIVRHGRYVVFQLAEVAVPRMLFAAILRRIDRLRGPPVAVARPERTMSATGAKRRTMHRSSRTLAEGAGKTRGVAFPRPCGPRSRLGRAPRLTNVPLRSTVESRDDSYPGNLG